MPHRAMESKALAVNHRACPFGVIESVGPEGNRTLEAVVVQLRKHRTGSNSGCIRADDERS